MPSSTASAVTQGTGADEPPDGLPHPRRWWAASAIWLSMTMAVLDGSIANVALPTIARELNADPASAIWIINAFQLSVTVLLLPLAALGDKLGYRRVYLTGLAVFVVGSLACALSQTLPQLAAARVLQGMGAAGLMSINPALVRFTFPRAMLGRGIGLNAVVISLSSALGPTVASGILAVAPWPWLFAINVPLGVLTILVGLRALPRTPGSGKPVDLISALLNAVTFGLIILGVEQLAREEVLRGAAMLVFGLAAGAVLVARELPRANPLVPIDLMRIPIFGLSVATSIVAFAGQMLAFLALPFLFQTTLGRSVVETGLLMTPWPLAVAVAAPLAGRLSDRYSAGALGALGLGVLAAGLLALSQMGPDPAVWDIAWRMVLCGLGFGFFQAPNNRILLSAAPLHRSGAAGGMLATARVMGQTAGAVAVAVIFHLAGTHATQLALGLAGALAAIAAVISLLRLRIVQPA